MGHRVERLAIDDYEEMLDFINLVFSMDHAPHDFTELLPAFYLPTEDRMGSHWVVREGGRIRSLVGIYPTTLHVGSRGLKVASVGAVSTHPRHRGQGMMSALMNHGLEWMNAEGIQLSELGGNRQRYAHFGYEVGGIELEFLLTAGSIGNAFEDGPVVVLEEVNDADHDLLAELKEMHDGQKLHCDRPIERFHSYGRNWKNRLCSIHPPDESCAGYLICSQRKDRISEIVSEQCAMNAICACVRESPKKRTTVSVGAHQIDLIRELGTLCETVTVKHSASWNVMDWASVTGAFLQLRSDASPLPDGKVIVGIDAVGSLELTVEARNTQCLLSDKPAPCSFPANQAQRILFGPLPPDSVAELPDTLRSLRSWCPLPLCMGGQDGA